jgi:hypothetical protein
VKICTTPLLLEAVISVGGCGVRRAYRRRGDAARHPGTTGAVGVPVKELFTTAEFSNEIGLAD